MRARQGDPAAQLELGYNFEFGDGVRQNTAAAVKWYRKAAEQGHARAQYNLGRVYADGEGVKQSYSEALKWFRRAAAQNYVLAKNRLGVMYERGQGVSRDYVEAYQWYTLAVEASHIAALVNRDHLAARMTAAQLGEARDRLSAGLIARLEGDDTVAAPGER